MEYVIVITGLTDTLTLRCIEDMVGDVKMYLEDEHIPFDDVYLKVQEMEGTDG